MNKLIDSVILFGLIIAIVYGSVVTFVFMEQNHAVTMIQEQNRTLQDENITLEKVIAERGKFVEAIQNFEITVKNTSGVIKTVNTQAEVNKLAQLVYDTIDTEQVAIDATKVVNDATDDLNEAYNRIVGDEAQNNEVSTRLAEGTVAYRALMDVAGDRDVTMSITKGACGVNTAVACVSSINPNHVYVETIYLNASFEQWRMVMLHEIAHMIQFEHNYEFINSDSYNTLFNKNVETHADCMAMVRYDGPETYRTGYNSVCSPEMLEVAGQAWDGVFK